MLTRSIFIAIALANYTFTALAKEPAIDIHFTCDHLSTYSVRTTGEAVKDSKEAVLRKITVDYDGKKEKGTLTVIQTNGVEESTEIANVYGSDESMYLTFIGGFDSYKQYLISLMLAPKIVYFTTHTSIKTESGDIVTSAELSHGKCDIQFPEAHKGSV